MKTVVYQIPVQPVEIKKGRDIFTQSSETLKKINDEAYHIANRAVTLWFNHLYPQPTPELEELRSARQKVKASEKALREGHAENANEDKLIVLKSIKVKELADWENKVAVSNFYRDVKETIRKEFPRFPEKLRKELLHKVVLDWLYAWMNNDGQNNFTANFPFYKHETHLPLCYGYDKIKWQKKGDEKSRIQQYELPWLNNIRFETCLSDLDKRLNKLIEYLYFPKDIPDVRNRKPHATLKPTLKQAGTKWSIHIPVLELVVPVEAEKRRTALYYIRLSISTLLCMGYKPCKSVGYRHRKIY